MQSHVPLHRLKGYVSPKPGSISPDMHGGFPDQCFTPPAHPVQQPDQGR